MVARYATLVLVAKVLAYYAHRDVVDYRDVMDLLTGKLGSLKLKYGEGGDGDNPEVECAEVVSTWEDIQDPPVVRTKGCGPSGSKGSQTHRKAQMCSKCGSRGHNRCSCSTNGLTTHAPTMSDAECEYVDDTDEVERAYHINAQLVSDENYG